MQQEIQGEIAGGPSAPVNGGTADVLIFAIEAGRYGPARLPQNLDAVGLKVATLCPEDNVLAQTDHAACHYRLPSSRSAPQLARALMAALTRSQARLVIPADEQTVVLLHHFIRGGCAKIIGVEGLAVLVRSLGRPDRLGAMLFKSQTLALARDLGLRVPPGGTAGFAGEALHIADQLGYPVYVKRSFGWSGLGVERCADAAALVAAMGTRPGGSLVAGAKRQLRHWLQRDWYPETSDMDVQGMVAGKPAFYCALAWQGQMVGGYAGEALSTTSDTGPSSEVRVGAHAGMGEATRRMIEALGCNGWVGFDFILEEGTGEPVLLECNPRPIQVCHLGYRIGVDLAAELARLLRGGAMPAKPLEASQELDVVLFPYALDPARQRPGALGDIPGKDAKLMKYGASLAGGGAALRRGWWRGPAV